MSEPAFIQDARRYLAVLHKRRALVFTALGASMVLAVLHNYTTRPVYEASAQILIDKAAPKVLPTRELVDPGVQEYQTEYELLRGRTLAERLVQKLDLQNTAELQTGPLLSPWERVQRLIGKTPRVPIGADGVPLSPAAAAVQSRLRVEPLPGGRLVNLRFQAYDPAVAAQLANGLADLYIEQSLEFRYTTSSEATDWLAERLQEQRKKVEAAERALLEYQERHGLTGQAGTESPGDDTASRLEAAVMATRMDRIAKETLINQVRALGPAQLATVPAVLATQPVQDARATLSRLQGEQARLAETLGERHPDMQRVRSDIQLAQEKLDAELRNAVRLLESDYQATRAKEMTLEANLHSARRQGLDQSRKAIEYNALKREVETSKQLFQALMSRSGETGLESELKSSNVRVVEKAEVPRAPVLPRRMRNYQLALLIGLVLGVALALLFEHLDNTVKTPEDVKELGLPFLGLIPDLEQRLGSPAAASPISARNPQSALADAYRVLRTNLLFACVGDRGKVVLVTSASPGEGKTTTAANLAVALALNGAKVLVIDADLRRPTMHDHLRLTRNPGLTDLIVGRCEPGTAIQTTRYGGLQALPCGYAAPNPAELLGSASLRGLLQDFRTRYDWVLIDTAPVLAMADTAVLCPLTDGVVLVVSAEKSLRPAVQRAVDQVSSVGGRLAGVALNRVNLRRNSYYYGQYYGEYYKSYYGRPAGAKPGRSTTAKRP